MTINYKKIISVLIVFVVALLTGFTVGKIYLSQLPPPSKYIDPASVREDDTYVQGLLSQVAAGKTAADFSNPLDLYLIAEQTLYSSESFLKVTTGNVHAAIVDQRMRGERLKVGDMFVFNKISPSSMAPIYSQIVYDRASQKVKISTTPEWRNDDSLEAGFALSSFQDHTMEEYFQKYNTDKPENVLSFILSRKNTSAENFSAITRDGDNFVFSVTLSNSSTQELEKMRMAAACYSYEVRTSSGAGPSVPNVQDLYNLPQWLSVKIEVTMDKNFRFQQIHYDEVYTIRKGIEATVTDNFLDTFQYENLPTLQDIARREVI